VTTYKSDATSREFAVRLLLSWINIGYFAM